MTMLGPIILLIVAISFFFIISFLLSLKKDNYKAHSIMRYNSQAYLEKKEVQKKEWLSITNSHKMSLIDLIFGSIKPLKKYAPSEIFKEAVLCEWELTRTKYNFIVLGTGSVVSFVLFFYLNENLIALIGYAVGLFSPRIFLYYQKKKFKNIMIDRLSIYMKTFANSISVFGNVLDSLNETIRLSHPSLKSDLTKVVSLLHAGKPITYAFREFNEKYPYNDIRFFHEMLEVAHDSGGENIEVLMNIAEDFEARKLLQAKLDTALAQAKKAYVLNCGIFFVLPFMFYFLQKNAYDLLMKTIYGPIVIITFSIILLVIYAKIEKLSQMDNFKNI